METTCRNITTNHLLNECVDKNASLEFARHEALRMNSGQGTILGALGPCEIRLSITWPWITSRSYCVEGCTLAI